MRKVSIITVVFNGADTIRDTIESVQEQDYENIEHVVLDGVSTDGTVDIIKGYGDRIDVFQSEPDDGLYDAMNKGIKLASGDIIATLNSDDFYAGSDVVRRMMELIAAEDLDAGYGDLEYIDGDAKDTIVRYWKSGTYEPGSFFKSWVPPHPTFFCKKELFERYGHFRTDMPCSADFELMLRFIERNKIRVGYLPKTMVIMRTGGVTNTTWGFFRGNVVDIVKAFRVNGYGFPFMYFAHKPFRKFRQFFSKSHSTWVTK